VEGWVPFGDDESFGGLLALFAEVYTVDADDIAPLQDVLALAWHIS
jgi:hypothetical protein